MAIKAKFAKGTLLQRQWPVAGVQIEAQENGAGSTLFVSNADASGFVIGDLVHYYGSTQTGQGDIVQNIVSGKTTGASLTTIDMEYTHKVVVQASSAADEGKLWYYDYEDIGNVTSITGPSPSTDQIDITSHNATSRFRESFPGGGLLESGELQVSLNYDPGLVGSAFADNDYYYKNKNDFNDLVSELDQPNKYVDWNWDVVSPRWKLNFPNTPKHVAFNGRITGAVFGAPIDGVHNIDLTIKVDGDITWPT